MTLDNIFVLILQTIFEKRPRGQAVSAPDFGSWGCSFESRWRQILPEPKQHFIAQSFMFTLPSSQNDWNTVEET